MELIVAITLMSVIGAVATPRFSEMMDSFRRSTVRVQLMQDLARGQAVAVQQGCRGIMVIASNGKSYTFGCDYLPYDTATTPTYDTAMFTTKLPNKITIGTDERVIFNTRGQVVDKDNILEPRTITLYLTQNGTAGAFANGTLRVTGFFGYN